MTVPGHLRDRMLAPFLDDSKVLKPERASAGPRTHDHRVYKATVPCGQREFHPRFLRSRSSLFTETVRGMDSSRARSRAG